MSQGTLEIRYSEEALRTLRRSNKRDLIRSKIEQLASDPEALLANVKRLQGRPESRLRVQDWRVIFRIEGSVLWIDKILPRRSAYEVQLVEAAVHEHAAGVQHRAHGAVADDDTFRQSLQQGLARHVSGSLA